MELYGRVRRAVFVEAKSQREVADIVKDYVRLQKVRKQEMFIPLTHAPGEAQADFGEAQVVIAGVEQTAHYLVMDLPHSDDCFVRA